MPVELALTDEGALIVASGLAFTTCVNEQLAVADPTLTEQLTGV